jgi:ribosomal protein L14
MFQKNSFSVPSDSSGILLIKIIQTRKCSTRKHAKIGKFLKVVIRNTKTSLNKVKKKKSRAIVVRTKHYLYTKKGKHYNFCDNAAVLLKKRMNSRGKELFGPTSKDLKIKKFRIAYRCVF